MAHPEHKPAFANHNTMNFAKAKYLSRGMSIFFFHFYSGLIMAASAKKTDRKEFVDKPKRILLSLR